MSYRSFGSKQALKRRSRRIRGLAPNAEIPDCHSGTSNSICHFLETRENGLPEKCQVNSDGIMHTLLQRKLLQEYRISLPIGVNGIVSSNWLSRHKVIFSTSDNKLFTYDVNKKYAQEIENFCYWNTHYNRMEIMELNPSKTLIAVSAKCDYELMIYQVPELNPLVLCIPPGYLMSIFYVSWINDTTLLASCGATVYIWDISEENFEYVSNRYIPVTRIKSKSEDFLLNGGICYNAKHGQYITMGALGKVYLFCVETLKKKLLFQLENSAVVRELRCQIYVATQGDVLVSYGSYSFSLYDIRAPLCCQTVYHFPNDSCIRKCGFLNDYSIITCGEQPLTLYDIRHDMTRFNISAVGSVTTNSHGAPTVYTYSYDSVGCRIFTGGEHGYGAMWT
ncbi:DDB1- and CUL4-associated factor 12-like [Teleopsis dalmanni]|uniref:DDB1- and CUL4-associated factor 12-like n=1 Tax=Teleopsis dalmanni TaxID=139649 RepID=UPI0018CC7DAF|nr:DDB1- and CUL4-associated factor 12-like [Teleopsis dalmanni]